MEEDGHRRPARRSRWRAVAAGTAVAALTAALAACGGEDSSSDTAPGETAASYPVKIINEEFPARQRLGETTRLWIGVKNTGDKPLPALTVTISIAGEEGQNSELPFGIRDPQPGLAQPDRPVWILSADYPRANGSSEKFGSETTSLKTFDFGPLKAGGVIDGLWQVTAVKTGSYRLRYEVAAGLSGEARAVTEGGTEARGSFPVKITEVPPETVVTDSGEVVPAPKPPTQANR